MKPLLHSLLLALLAGTLAGEPAIAQTKVQSQSIRDTKQKNPAAEIVRDFSRLPEPVRAKREAILAAARNGDLAKAAALVKTDQTAISFGGDTDAEDFWKRTFRDSEGLEALSMLTEVLEMPFVHLDKGTAQEMYVWPYFHALDLEKLTPSQRVELFRLVTAYDYREMQKFGSYNFFRAGISPDGRWQFFVAGD